MSALRGLKGGQYQPLSEKDIETIHEGSMYLFEKVGLEVYGRRALEIFKDKGAG
jgi:trimethylamine:corrinoid methyltransferase-like protein